MYIVNGGSVPPDTPTTSVWLDWTALDIATPYLLAHKFDQMTTVCEN